MSFSESFFSGCKDLSSLIDADRVEDMVRELQQLRERKGRLFFIGVGGSAANCSHAVNDFRKLCGIESYAPTDNVSEFTARINDEGWETVFSTWLSASNFSDADAVFVMSVGGGSIEKNVSVNLIKAVDFVRERDGKVFAICGRDGGYVGSNADCEVRVPVVNADLVTPYSEAFQAVIWHCIVSHPELQMCPTKW